MRMKTSHTILLNAQNLGQNCKRWIQFYLTFKCCFLDCDSFKRYDWLKDKRYDWYLIALFLLFHVQCCHGRFCHGIVNICTIKLTQWILLLEKDWMIKTCWQQQDKHLEMFIVIKQILRKIMAYWMLHVFVILWVWNDPIRIGGHHYSLLMHWRWTIWHLYDW